MEQKARKQYTAKNLIYSLLLIMSYVLQETPGFLQIKEVRPILVIGVIVAIAMQDGELAGGLYGLFGGILCDMAAFHLFGVASMFFLVLGCCCGLLIIYLVQPNRRSAFLLTFVFALIYGVISYYLIYGMWGYEGAHKLILTKTLPCALYTAFSGIIMFEVIKLINRKIYGDDN